MKIDRADLDYLALPAGIALVVILAGIAAVITTQNFAFEAQADLERAKVERAAIQIKLMRATEEEREIRARMVDYKRLRERGVIGDERRLDWLDTVTNIKNERGIFDFRYTIEARRPLQYPGFKRVAGVDFLDSRMKLESELLHEGDLFTVLTDLRAKLAPYVIVRSCIVSRSAKARPDAYGPHVRAECIVDLVTIQDRGETKQ
jgi:hypothetical protein